MRHRHGIPHSIASGQGAYFTAKQVWQGAHTPGIQGPLPGPHHPRAAGLTEWPI